jgi:hypothetical protein
MKMTEEAKNFGHPAPRVRVMNKFSTKIGWAIFWAIFSQTHLVTLFESNWAVNFGAMLQKRANSPHNPRANPTIASYNASVVNLYNATGSLARFENKNM